MSTLSQQFNAYAMQDFNNIEWAFYSDSDDDFDDDFDSGDDEEAIEYNTCECSSSTNLEDPIDCI